VRALSRRAAIGVSAIAAAGAGAVAVGESERGRRWLHVVGVVRGPDLAVPNVDVPVVTTTFTSDRMHRRVHWSLAVPLRVAPTALLVCLHGRNQDRDFAFRSIGLHKFVADAGLPWAVVSVDGGSSTYWHERADGRDPQAMVFDELVPMVRDKVGDLPVALVGWSMGGYGALLAAAERTGIAAVAAASPAVWRRFEQSTPGSFDSADDFARHDLFALVDRLRAASVRIDCGIDDPFEPTAHALAEAIGAEHDSGDGFHDAAYWRSRVPAQLGFLGAQLPT
jgi:pimeloyl-ACP methyl ester carboxylesterase